MNDKFDYVYDKGHWVKPEEDDHIGIGSIIETVLTFLALAVCLLAVTMLFLAM
jgi:hypothetical protein